MDKPFRVIDLGIRDGRWNIALDQALIDCHKAGLAPDTIRFLSFPPTALVGRHQALAREVRLDYCRAHGIAVGRRITGGGAIYLDEGQIGWELIFHRRTLKLGNLADLAREICKAAAAGLRRLGVEAHFRPRNDIEVGGRKISGTGGYFDGDTLFYQGTLLIAIDSPHMTGALNVPEHKLRKRALDGAGQRVVSLRELLGPRTPPLAAVKQALLDGFAAHLGITPQPGALSAKESTLADGYFAHEIGTDAFVHEIDDPSGADIHSGQHVAPGGVIIAHVRFDGAARDRIRRVLITGDFFVTPPRLVYDLEARLQGVAVQDAPAVIEDFFKRHGADLLSVKPSDFIAALVAAMKGEGAAAAAR
ncbi:MAG: lipoate--protein ligase family protein [Pseudomonadota bacterium]